MAAALSADDHRRLRVQRARQETSSSLSSTAGQIHTENSEGLDKLLTHILLLVMWERGLTPVCVGPLPGLMTGRMRDHEAGDSGVS